MDKETEEFIIKEFGSVEAYEKRVNAINKKARKMQAIEEEMKDSDISIADMLDQDTFGLDTFRGFLMEDVLVTICRLAERGREVAKWRSGDSIAKEFQKIEDTAKDVLSHRFCSEELDEMFRYDSKRSYKNQLKDKDGVC